MKVEKLAKFKFDFVKQQLLLHPTASSFLDPNACLFALEEAAIAVKVKSDMFAKL